MIEMEPPDRDGRKDEARF